MNQREAVILVMKENGGYATLGHIYEYALKVSGVEWKTKTPFASIRRIVQNEKYFFKIQPGLWALNEFKDKIPFIAESKENAPKEKQDKFNHSYFQGLLVEIGNLKHLDTFVPAQDKNRKYLEKPLQEVTSLSKIYDFSYETITQTAQTIDVSWFNERKLPDTFIEVEHSTNFYTSLIKFFELQDFYANFWVAAPAERKELFVKRITKSAFSLIKNRVKFISYDDVSRLHSNLSEQAVIERRL